MRFAEHTDRLSPQSAHASETPSEVHSTASEANSEPFERDEEDINQESEDELCSDGENPSAEDYRPSFEEELLIFFIGSNISVVWMKFLLTILRGRVEGDSR